jgi:hypothetical protein
VSSQNNLGGEGMNKIKAVLASIGSVMVMALATVAPAAADATSTNNCSNGAGANSCSATAIDDSVTLTVSGNCSGIFQLTNAQFNVLLGQVNGNALGSGNVVGGAGSSNSQSNNQSSSQSNSNSFTFSPKCVTNVTKLAAASGGKGAAAPVAAQVQAPKGAVHAGAGGGLAETSALGSLIGLTGSISAAGIGLSLRKRASLNV